MECSQEFSCLCDPKMAARMDRVITLAGGEISDRDEYGFGVRLQVRKT
jgi:hypothetical protein